MAEMTDEEADALDELWTRTTPEIDTSKSGYFTEHMAHNMTHLVEVDRLTTQWLGTMTESTHKTTAEIIGALVREKISASV
ncbi:hypothetical protein FACS189494_12070 [Spirochaetia bacterium]|nr:hypothetical protein FACS189494_12070 [Spirochaetia bacterium]